MHTWIKDVHAEKSGHNVFIKKKQKKNTGNFSQTNVCCVGSVHLLSSGCECGVVNMNV